MNELRGICPKCGASYNDGLLTIPVPQQCERCGSDLEISESHVRIRTSYSSSAVRTYRVASSYKRKYGGGSTIIN